MKKRMLSLAVLAASLFCFSNGANAQKTEKLFNGKDLSNWNFVVDKNSVPADQVYSVRDGKIFITGSMPLLKEDGALYNVGYLIRRDGSYEMYEKVHVTPDEQKSWGLSGGKMVKTFDTDCARIGVLICYDVEFPELSRRSCRCSPSSGCLRPSAC